MYTGIIHGAFEVVQVEYRDKLTRFCVAIDSEYLHDLKVGGSIAVDGICHTATVVDKDGVWFDSMEETIATTTIKYLKRHQKVNIERSVRVGDENGGHDISGHIDGTLPVVGLEKTENNHVITFEVPAAYREYVFNKGFLNIHGASLTVSHYDKESGRFKVFLIPETLRLSNLGELRVGDHVNFEIDRKTQVIIETVKRYLAEQIA